MLFSRHGIHWGSPAGPITLDKILNHMTPEQRELLMVKCQKQDVRQADLTLQAVLAAVGKALGGKGISPSDILDIQLGYPMDEDGEPAESDGPKDYTPTERRTNKFESWNWSDQTLANWLVGQALKHNSDDHALNLYFTDDEAAELGFCLLNGREHERESNPFAD